MTSVQSIGLHEPKALTYLVAESILPEDPPKSSYKWSRQIHQEKQATVIDEVVSAKNCVVWTRNNTIQRVFNLDIEGEPLLHSFVTHFDTLLEAAGSSVHPTAETQTEPALIAILKTQAHIFLLSGDVHVLPLPFETENALPCVRGFVLQRKPLHRNDSSTNITDKPPSNLQEPRIAVKKRNEQSSVKATTPQAKVVTESTSPNFQSKKVPCTYSFTELLSELGIVVSGLARKSSKLEDGHLLPDTETIIHISSSDELKSNVKLRRDPLHICITVNAAQKSMTLWQVVLEKSITLATSQNDAAKARNPSKRKSSNIYQRQAGVATPVSRGPGTFRESFGGLGQTFTESSLLQTGKDTIAKQASDLVAQLGQEFEHGGVQTRSARRVSSMLARTDLGGPNDRNTFHELSMGATGRKSLARSVRRGESLGGFSDRQSFGRRRSSFQANSSVWSEGTSFLDLPASHLLEDRTGLHGVEAFDQDYTEVTASQHPRHMGLLKLKSVQFDQSLIKSDLQDTIRVMTLLAPDRSTADERRSQILSVCIMNRSTSEMTIINLAIKPQWGGSTMSSSTLGNDIRATDVHCGQGITDACLIRDGSVERLLTLTQTRDGQSVFHLEAPWSSPYRVELPHHFKVFDNCTPVHSELSVARRDVGTGRIIPRPNVDATGFGHTSGNDQVLLLDKDARAHVLRVQLLPSDNMVRKILEVANFVLGPDQNDSLLVAWWEVMHWLKSQSLDVNMEWMAVTITLFLLIVPFLNKKSENVLSPPRRRKGGILRSSSGLNPNMEHWNQMMQILDLEHGHSWLEGSSWSWIMSSQTPRSRDLGLISKHKRTASISRDPEQKKDLFLVRCSNLARDFLQSPQGESAIGPEGYLPVAVNKDRNTRGTALASVVVGLHLLREECKLNSLVIPSSSNSPNDIGLIIAQLATWLHWSGWSASPSSYYGTEIVDISRWAFDTSEIEGLEIPTQRFDPPSIFKHVEDSIKLGNVEYFPSLLGRISQSRHISVNHPLYRMAISLTPRLFALTTFLRCMKDAKNAEEIIESMLSSGIDQALLGSIPDGVAAAIYQATIVMRTRAPVSWSEEAYRLIGREDLTKRLKTNELRRAGSVVYSHEAVRDYRSLANLAIEADIISRWDASHEIDRQTVTKLIFKDDRRFQEASKLVNQTRPPTVECNIEPGWSEGDLLEAQKELAQHVSRRTFSVSAGRGIMHFNARVPLLTERVPIPAFTPQCIIKPRGASDTAQPMTFSADKAFFTEEKTCWAFFHNGASAGLMISKDAKWIDTSWILYNKPAELTNRHAGFLLSLGLNGHLKSLAKWVAFKYLTPKHTMTSVGLLLGLAASYLGTADTLITRLLSVHVTRLLPVGAVELNLSPLTQTAGLMGIGLLYHNSQHRRMSEVMLSEIENNEPEEPAGDEAILRDEGYRLAAGFSLGLINLGQGSRLHSLHDMSVVERLLTIAVGTKNVNMVHVLDRATAGAVIAVAFIFLKTNDISIAKKIDIPDTLHQFDYVRPDVFLLRTLARHLIMWNSIEPSRNFIRDSLPLVYRHRADLGTTKHLSTDDLPFFYILAGICFSISLRYAGSRRFDVRDLLLTYLDQFWRMSKLPALNYDSKITLNSVRSCLDVLALSCAIVMAGSGDLLVMRRLRGLHGRTDTETPFGSHLAAHMALGTLFLSGGTATFSTSDLAVASIIIAFYPVFPTDMLDNRGHLQALRHFWVLAVDNRCLLARDIETGQVISGIEAQVKLIDGSETTVMTPGLLPDLDAVVQIQFEHEAYWPVNLNLSSPSPDTIAIPQQSSRTLRDDLKSDPKKLSILLSRRSAYEQQTTTSSTFTNELQSLDANHGIPSLDPNTPTNELWKHMHTRAHPGGESRDPLQWIFSLKGLQNLDYTDKALVLDNTLSTGGTMVNTIPEHTGSDVNTNHAGRKLLQGTIVDTKLEFEIGTLGIDLGSNLDDEDYDKDANPTNSSSNHHHRHNKSKSLISSPLSLRMDKNKLWQLRLLFAWADKWDEDEGDQDGDEDNESKSPQWLKREVIERLRWRVWKMAQSSAAAGAAADGDGNDKRKNH